MLGTHVTWVKWSQPTAEALRQGCLARDTREFHMQSPDSRQLGSLASKSRIANFSARSFSTSIRSITLSSAGAAQASPQSLSTFAGRFAISRRAALITRRMSSGFSPASAKPYRRDATSLRCSRRCLISLKQRFAYCPPQGVRRACPEDRGCTVPSLHRTKCTRTPANPCLQPKATKCRWRAPRRAAPFSSLHPFKLI